MRYQPSTTEKKWQERWTEQKLYQTNLSSKKPHYYNLVMFPYPSGDRLHVGHWYNFAPSDSFGRFMKMQGYEVFEPMGYDSFGLPAENFAIKTGVAPQESTARNIKEMIRQLKAVGAMYDWDRMVVTSDPEYYRWTQWIFLELYRRGLCYKKTAPVNWCPSCQTVLANEQVKEGLCDRCDTEVVQKDLAQWFFKITDYAEHLLDYDGLDWPNKTMLMQQNWIGKSQGITYTQKVKDLAMEFQSYDSVPQTFMAQTFAVIAPDHPRLAELIAGTEQEKDVLKFADKIKKKKVANKFNVEKEVEGIFTGRYIENPFGTGDLPIWVASFVIADYGSGVVNCSAHDERDFAFAKKYGIPLRPVMFPQDEKEAEKVRNLEYAYHHDPEAILTQPEQFNGRKWGEVREDILDFLEKKGMGKRTTNYKLRDWLISRQRFWGAPIPIVNCKKCGEVPVPPEALPVVLPLEGVDYKPKGKAPLASSPDFMNTSCPTCGGPAEREPDTMDTFVCSSWYYLRYLTPHNEEAAFDPKMVNNWLPVNMYIGGPEHACMHLLYARFIHKVLMEDPKAEPFKRLVHQGLITKDGAKMSKSKGNVVSPDEFVEKYGSDVFRMYLMFMGPFTDGGDWNDRGITGISRFVDKLWRLMNEASAENDTPAVARSLHAAIKKVGEDISSFHFNTALSTLMELTTLAQREGISAASKKLMIQLIAPMAPHFAEECWEALGQKESVFNSSWPTFDEKLLVVDEFELVVQVNGKVRARVMAPHGISKEEAIEKAAALPGVQKYLSEGTRLKDIYVPNKLVSFVVKPN
ncbi:leucine--tRNA ligase [Candidatus Peregrinibacteria bacterium CG_4_9_14_0_2_um_filter_53_11]|nr:MAG: leucine--tRNA ligase [Candidatus Peregrinibacteria bacterium CG_4_9_14_0_2_um_filter_53_11]